MDIDAGFGGKRGQQPAPGRQQAMSAGWRPAGARHRTVHNHQARDDHRHLTLTTPPGRSRSRWKRTTTASTHDPSWCSAVGHRRTRRHRRMAMPEPTRPIPIRHHRAGLNGPSIRLARRLRRPLRLYNHGRSTARASVRAPSRRVYRYRSTRRPAPRCVHTSPKQFFVRVTPQSALRVAEAISLARLLEQHALPTVTLGQWGNWRRSWHGIRESLLTGR